jgi:hypothetical protein
MRISSSDYASYYSQQQINAMKEAAEQKAARFREEGDDKTITPFFGESIVLELSGNYLYAGNSATIRADEIESIRSKLVVLGGYQIGNVAASYVQNGGSLSDAINNMAIAYEEQRQNILNNSPKFTEEFTQSLLEDLETKFNEVVDNLAQNVTGELGAVAHKRTIQSWRLNFYAQAVYGKLENGEKYIESFDEDDYSAMKKDIENSVKYFAQMAKDAALTGKTASLDGESPYGFTCDVISAIYSASSAVRQLNTAYEGSLISALNVIGESNISDRYKRVITDITLGYAMANTYTTGELRPYVENYGKTSNGKILNGVVSADDIYENKIPDDIGGKGFGNMLSLYMPFFNQFKDRLEVALELMKGSNRE